MSWADVFPVLVAVASSGVMVTSLQVWSKRGETNATEAKIKADAAEVNSRTAIMWSEQQARQIASLQEQQRQYRSMLSAYQLWSKSVVELARAAGLEIDDPPEMWL